MRLAVSFATAGLLAATAASGATYDGDAAADVFFITSDNQLTWWEATGANNVVAPVAVNGSTAGTGFIGANRQSLATGRLDADGSMDLMAGGAAGGIGWYEATGADNALRFVGTPISATVRPNGMAVGDFDGDGRGDIHYVGATGNVERAESNANDALSALSRLTTVGTSLAVGRVDADGAVDVLVSKGGAAPVMAWYEATGADNGIVHVKNTGVALGNLIDVAVGDFDGNGFNDMFTVDPSGLVRWWESNTGVDNATPALLGTVESDSGATSVAFGDVDGDGSNELLVGHAATGVTWYEMNGTTPGLGGLQAVAGTPLGLSGIKDIAIVSVPEPASIGLVAAAGAVLLLRRRR